MGAAAVTDFWKDTWRQCDFLQGGRTLPKKWMSKREIKKSTQIEIINKSKIKIRKRADECERMQKRSDGLWGRTDELTNKIAYVTRWVESGLFQAMLKAILVWAGGMSPIKCLLHKNWCRVTFNFRGCTNRLVLTGALIRFRLLAVRLVAPLSQCPCRWTKN